MVNLPQVLVEVGGEVWRLSVVLETEGEHAGGYTGLAVSATGADPITTDLPRGRIGDALRGVAYTLLMRVTGGPAEDVRRSLEFAAGAGVPQTDR